MKKKQEIKERVNKLGKMLDGAFENDENYDTEALQIALDELRWVLH